MISDWRKQTAVTDSRLFEGSAFKERVNRDFSRQFNSTCIQQECSINDHGGSSSVVASEGMTMPSLVDLEQFSGGVFPQHMSSQLHDLGPNEVGPAFAGTFSNPSSGYSEWIRYEKELVQNQTNNHVSGLSSLRDIVELNRYGDILSSNFNPGDTNALSSSKAFGKPMLNHGFISQCGLQALQTKQSRFQPCPPPAHPGPYGAPLNRFDVGQKNIQPQGFSNIRASKPVGSIRPLHHILLSYVNSKYKLMGACKSRQEFLDRLHLAACRGVICKCEKYRILLSHFDNCQNTRCDICGPVLQLCMKKKVTTGLGYREGCFPGGVHSRGYIIPETQPALKRVKMAIGVQHDDWSLGAVVRQHLNTITTNKEQLLSEGFISSDALNKQNPSSAGNIGESLLRSNSAFDGTRLETGFVNTCKVKSDGQSLNSDGISVLSEELTMDEAENTERMSEAECDGGDAKCELDQSNCQPEKKLEDLKVSGVSLIDFFTPEQIKEHLHSLNQCTDLSAGKGLAGDTRGRTVDDNTCQLCDVGGRTFAPPPMYCTSCGARIKHGSNYYRSPDDGVNVKYCFCTLCFKASRGGNISFRGLSFSKAKLEKCKNFDEFPEGWVQCDKCEAWQHQICALYNSKQDLEGKLDYVCPFCRLLEIEAKGQAFIPPAFGARDLPRTKLSDHIERRLFRSLEKERKQRAELLGKSPEEVAGAENLVVRVVLAVNKELKVKQQFLDILHGETYPTEFPYKSKVILLFQKVEGVDVCLFAMYLQEFGSECGYPNKRSVYISYLDSVKYFRPEIKTVDGVALRTFVYHEILIGYLDYCKQRGFTTCYIWACPPLRGEDYILYCHPETQKTPNPHKLLQWYKKLLRKAKEENVVVDYTNFYDHFFVPSGECNSEITAARLPYFDGDYWSCAIDDMIRTIDKESGGVSEKKSKIHTTKRALRAMGHNDLSVDKAKDILVMQKLGQTILPLKEDFFVVHLQFSCANCHEPILSGSRQSCNLCTKFHLCHRCLELEQNSNVLRTHTSIHGGKHQFSRIPVNDVAADTEDKDVILENDFFDDRQSLLKYCQENHYQFDTLRRAKHSSMMILHRLKTTTTQTACSICHQDATAEGLCRVCSEFHAGTARTFLEALGELNA